MDVFPEVILISDAQTVNLPDFDIAVAFNRAVNEAGCPVVVFGWAQGQRLHTPPGLKVSSLGFRSGVEVVEEWLAVDMTTDGRTSIHSKATEQEPWAELTRDTLSRAQSEHWSETQGFRAMRYLAIEEYGDRTQGVFEELTDQILTPLLRLNDGTVVAGLAKTEEGHPLLLLPEWTPNKRAWLLAAWRTWVGDKSMLAPPPPSGYEVEAWMTAAELDVHDQIVARQDELSALRDRLEGEIAELTEDLTATSSAAAVGFRRLLTAQGDPLVAAVEEALGLFEFRVQNMDEVFEEKREDLRVEEPDESWTALVEVKGYTKAGKANDFSKFTKHTRLFMSEQGRAPNACWYVINAYCGQAPAARPGPFDSSQDAVKHFAEYADGLVVPTTELFKLVRDVQRGDRTPHEARTLLLNAREQFKHAPAASVAALPLPDGER